MTATDPHRPQCATAGEVDTSEHLLAELRRHSAGLDIEVAVGDLMGFPEHMSERADLVLCMGDTLTHLHDEEQVQELMRLVAGSLRAGGRFVATFRDYRQLPHGSDRFILVRSDAERILTCFLEEADQHVVVHDVFHERRDAAWEMRASSYRKLRLSPTAVVDAATAAGLRCTVGDGPRGMVEVRAELPAR